jgi:integrase
VIETAHRTLEACNQVFAFAIATGLATSIPGRDLKVALKKPVPRHFPAILDPERLGEVLRSIEGYRGTATVRACLQLTPMLLLRPGELRLAEWSEINLETGVWTIPALRMKLQKQQKLEGPPHIVTLPRQAQQILKELHLLTGHKKHVFCGVRPKRPLSNNTVNSALRNMGYTANEVVAHGFRATARTMLAEILGVKPVLIETQLAHTIKDPLANSHLGTAYDRAKWLRHRAAMLQLWADYLDHLRDPSRYPFTVPELQLTEALQQAS